jgi:hypothetical protein
VARRFNVETTLRATLHVRADGGVDRVEFDGGHPVFVDAAKRALKKWKFEKRPEGSVVKYAVPFRLTGDRAVSNDETIRARLFTPSSAAEVKRVITPGFMYVRLLIDTRGKVVGRFVTSCEPAAFEDSGNAIVDALQFEPVETSAPGQPHTLNVLLIDYATDGVIRVQQRSGAPGN